MAEDKEKQIKAEEVEEERELSEEELEKVTGGRQIISKPLDD